MPHSPEARRAGVFINELFDDGPRLAAYAAGAPSCKAIIDAFDVTYSGHVYAVLRAAAAKHGVTLPPSQRTGATSGQRTRPAHTRRSIPTADGPAPTRGVFSDVERVRRAALDAATQADILTALGVSPDSKNYRSLHRTCAAHRIELPVVPGANAGPCPFDDREKMLAAIAASNSTTAAVRFLGLSPCGSTNGRFAKAADRAGLVLPWKTSRPDDRNGVPHLKSLPAAEIAAAMRPGRRATEVIGALGAVPSGRAYQWFNAMAEMVAATAGFERVAPDDRDDVDDDQDTAVDADRAAA